MLADAVGLALFVVLDTLPPAERLAFVLHDVFAVPFDQIAPIVDRTPEATRKLASRARRRIQQADPVPDAGMAAQREAVDAFFAAGRDGDFDRLVSVLDPDVVLRGDFGPGAAVVRAEGAPSVAKLARSYAGPEREVRAATVNGAAGAVIFVAGQPTAIMGFVVRGGRVAAIDVLADPQRIARIDLSAVTGYLSVAVAACSSASAASCCSTQLPPWLTNNRCLVTGPANFGPEMATSAWAAFGPAGAMFVTLNVSGNFPSRYALRRSWSATWPSSGVMPFSTRLVLVVYDTPGSVAWVHRLDNWSGRRQVLPRRRGHWVLRQWRADCGQLHLGQTARRCARGDARRLRRRRRQAPPR